MTASLINRQAEHTEWLKTNQSNINSQAERQLTGTMMNACTPLYNRIKSAVA